METKEVFVEVGGKSVAVVIKKRSGKDWFDRQEMATEGIVVNKDGSTTVKSKQGVKTLMKEISDGIGKYPEGINDFGGLLEKISEQDTKMLLKEIKEFNSAGDVEKKSEQ